MSKRLLQVANQQRTLLPPHSPKAYTFAYWKNGWRKYPSDTSSDILCFETGYFGMEINLEDFTSCKFGLFDDDDDGDDTKTSYAEVLDQQQSKENDRMESLETVPLLLEIETKGKVYKATKIKGIDNKKDRGRLRSAILMESGRFVQHYDLMNPLFEVTDEGEGNHGEEYFEFCPKIVVYVWTDSISVSVNMSPPAPVENEKNDDEDRNEWTNTTITLQFGDWKTEYHKSGRWKPDKAHQLILTCDITPSNMTTTSLITDRNRMKTDIRMKVMNKKYPKLQTFPVQYNEITNSMRSFVKNFKRNFVTGLNEIRGYDEMLIEIVNSNEEDNEEKEEPYYIPFLLAQRGPASIQGLCPMLCLEDGTPTGIPVQLSKNFHSKEYGWYATFYMMLPSPPRGEKVTYMLRTAFGFYGPIPTACHANLSLYGYHTPGHNGRWEQLTIGCWGETYCMDIDMSAARQTITDVRMLFSRQGINGTKWMWTDAGWGGDWLHIEDDRNRHCYQTNWKSAYMAHGPCLTDSRYSGYYGSERQVYAQAQVQTLRTDDYARIFTKLDYLFQTNFSTAGGYLFKQGTTPNYETSKVAWGNKDGLVEEQDVPKGIPRDKNLIERQEIPGSAPFWIAFPGANLVKENWRGKGWRALIIRSYEAILDGKTYTNPSITFASSQPTLPNMDLYLTVPKSVTDFHEGDSIKFEAEWITIHHVADDYYGPNESYRSHLLEHSNSWETVYREASGNDIQVEVTEGGELVRNYPIAIKATKGSDVKVNLVGGVGAVPMQFIGLDSRDYTLYQVKEDDIVKLDQSVHGNDFWQTDYDPLSFSFTKTYNIQLDDVSSSSWVLRKD